MEEEFQNVLINQRHQLTNEELQALLEQHRREKARLIEQRRVGKAGYDDKLKEKLEERKRKMLKKTDKVTASFVLNPFAAIGNSRGNYSRHVFTYASAP